MLKKLINNLNFQPKTYSRDQVHGDKVDDNDDEVGDNDDYTYNEGDDEGMNLERQVTMKIICCVLLWQLLSLVKRSLLEFLWILTNTL